MTSRRDFIARSLNLFKGLVTFSSAQLSLNDDDIVLFVVGHTGSGKSTFIQTVTQVSDLKPEHSLQPVKGKVQVVKCTLTEEAQNTLMTGQRKNIVFVDTPSFHTDPVDSRAAEDAMKTWLKKSKSKSTCVGVIYMHRIENDPDMADEAYSFQKQLNTFALAFPEDLAPNAFPKRLHCVFSSTDGMSEKRILEHEGKFLERLDSLLLRLIPKRQLRWTASIHPDLFLMKDDPKPDPIAAWDAVVELFTSPGFP